MGAVFRVPIEHVRSVKQSNIVFGAGFEIDFVVTRSRSADDQQIGSSAGEGAARDGGTQYDQSFHIGNLLGSLLGLGGAEYERLWALDSGAKDAMRELFVARSVSGLTTSEVKGGPACG